MPALETPVAEIGWNAPDFALPGVDGKTYTLKDVAGPKGLVVMFICNHCPFVKAILDRILRDAKELQAMGVGVVAISANDAENYPEDSFENMQKLSKAKAFPFPYLYDESQQVAKAYDAVCTPDFFGFDKDLKLQYRGRLDASRMEPVPNAKRDLFEAMKDIAVSGKTSGQQYASMGCSIKWRE